MIKFSVSHSSILEAAGEALKTVEHAAHLDKIARLLKHAGAEVLEVTRINVTAELAEEEFHKLFDIAEHEVQHFYGEVLAFNEVIAKFVNHLEHHPNHGHHGHHEYC